jgi:hypothetical protein
VKKGLLSQVKIAKGLPAILLLTLLLHWPVHANEMPDNLSNEFAEKIDKHLQLPTEEVYKYSELMAAMLSEAGVSVTSPQYVVVVDRNPNVQVILVFLKSADTEARFIGASPVSTGRLGEFDHFETPIGVFEHSIDNLDFRAEGTKNEFGICGYGAKGMRVYDFGWQQAYKGWGDRSLSTMRLQMHATDPNALEAKLGSVQSKGCIRIPATLNHFIDHYGLLDADYEAAMLLGRDFWVLPQDRAPTLWSGRYLVIVDTYRKERPYWSPPPVQPVIKVAPRKKQ